MKPMSKPRKIAAAFAIAAVAIGGLLFWRHERGAIAPADVAAFLDATSGAGRVRFAVTAVDALRRDDSGVQIAVAAKAWPVQALYAKADTADYLQKTVQLDPDSTSEARSLLADKATVKNTQLTGGRPIPEDPFQAVILEAATPAGASFDFQGILDAHRAGDAWAFSLVSGGFEGAGPRGDPRSSFAGATFVEGDAADEARLRSLAADFKYFASRVAAAREASGKAKSAEIGGRRAAFLARIAPGRVYSGTAVEAGEQSGTALYLEFTGTSADNGVSALLRNEGGWHSARPFEGTWASDDDFGNVTVSLSSPAGEAVRNAGPFLENTQNWSLELRMDPSGVLSGQSRSYRYQFQPLLPAQVPALRDRLETEYRLAVAATEPGSLYQGTAAPVAPGPSEPVLLRITGRSEDGSSFEASIESPTHPWKRAVHGMVIANARRSHGEPLRLRSDAKEAVEDAPAASVLGDQEDLELSLGLRDGSLVGEDARFGYRLSPAGDNDLRRLDAGRAERARRFGALVRPGISFDGTLHEDQGFITHVRLEIVGFDRGTGAVRASIRSLARPGVFREFTGAGDPSAGALALTATDHGSYGESGDFDVPFLTGPTASTLHLELAGSSLKGRIEGDPHWTLEFPAAAFLSATSEGTEPGSPPADGSVFPAFPSAQGAYLLSKGAWAPMPKNQGHVATETETDKSGVQLPPNIIGAVNAGLAEFTKSKDKKKITYLEFPGKDPLPSSSGQALVILFVGPEPKGKSALELAPTELQKDGQRRIELAGKSETEIRFWDQGVAAYIRRPAPGFLLFTTTGALAPGNYALNADGGCELTQE
jgi:hypothetical protein